MSALSDIVTVMRELQKSGWVHGDVSVGNIVACKGGAKLVDLDFAKEGGSMVNQRIRMGTMDFMAVEVDAQDFIFFSSPNMPGLSFADLLAQPTSVDAEQPFFHNHLHDLESLWWVAVWMVFHHQFLAPGEDRLSDIDEVASQIKPAQRLFPPIIHPSHRLCGLRWDFPQLCKSLQSNKAVVCQCLNILRRILLYNYRIMESTFPTSIDPSAFQVEIYEDFKEAFSMSRRGYPDCRLDFIPSIYVELYIKKMEMEKEREKEKSKEKAMRRRERFRLLGEG